ncbi:hypothetical protein [Flavobacterium sp. UMI-01]|uniref:hypothetical protein n=1 Tax=Flavobacterium sp. UMI-01 TaxID=1441053 RepID=UPI001C7CFABF|nr:hypothetical protein [Flavobacterium sp. UMI-01]GIZ08384.1 hypothetical protein FUMI01_11110 [Flavobacterium sp. UMI-01]
MALEEQILNYVRSINQTLILWKANAKKAEELPEMETVNPDALVIVSEQVAGIYTSKKLTLQKLIESLSLSGQNNKVREVILGSITEAHDLNYLLENTGITVTEDEMVILTALATVNATLVQRQFLWKLGKGEFNPIGSTDINTKLIELQPRFINEIVADELTSSPIAIVYDFGTITDPILDVINTADPARDYTDDEKIYYIRAIKDDVKLLYNFIGINGIYGDGEDQMTEDDLVLVYSSSNADMTDVLNTKLDKGTYTGNADDLLQEAKDYADTQDTATLATANSYTDSVAANKVDKDGAKVLSDNNYSTAEKNKLASIDATHYLAPLQSLADLSAMPQASISDKARVYVENDLSDYFYDATASSGDVAPDDQVGGVGFWRKVAVGGETPTSIKTKYESNADTNAYTDADKAKVTAIDQSVSSAEKTIWNGKVDASGVLATILSGLSAASGTFTSSDTVLTAFGKIKYLIDNIATTYQAILTDVNFGTFINGLTAKTTPVDADFDIIMDSADSNKLKKVSWANRRAASKTYNDTLYAPKFTPVVSIGSNTTLDDTYNGKVILLTANATITLPNGLATNFGVTISTKTGVTLTLSLGGSVTLLNNTGTTMSEKLSCTLLNTGTANEYLTAGNL